jgi:4-amino-4-deoxy-L-arabinose transferase-like glycosyltransferase
LIVLPIWGASVVGLEGLLALRLPVALLSATAVPLTWMVGRRLVGNSAGLLAAGLLALSPVFLLYGRTATTVGLSLVPALLTVYVLVRMLSEPWSWRRLIVLQALIVTGGYAYAPIRFLWPLSVVLFAIGIWYRREMARRYILAGLVTLCVLPVVVTAVDDPAEPNVGATIIDYYYARGEQILKFTTTPTRYSAYLDEGADVEGSRLLLAGQLIARNMGDFANLLIDRDTSPAITRSWASDGRLYPLVLVPFFFVGLGNSIWRARDSMEHAALLVLFLGFGAPILLTSKVHVGRLIFFLPVLILLVASGFIWTVRTLLARMDPGLSKHAGIATVVACSALMLAVAWSTWTDFYRTAASPNDESKAEMLLRSMYPDVMDHGGVVLVWGEKGEVKESVLMVSVLRYSLSNEYRVIDVRDQPDPFDVNAGLPPLYHGITTDHLADPASIPGGCTNMYVVESSVVETFTSSSRSWHSVCGSAPTVVPLKH